MGGADVAQVVARNSWQHNIHLNYRGIYMATIVVVVVITTVTAAR